MHTVNRMNANQTARAALSHFHKGHITVAHLLWDVAKNKLATNIDQKRNKHVA